MKVLFICTANCSRSAMAEAYFRHLCKQNKLDQDVICESAGTNAPLAPEVIEEEPTEEIVEVVATKQSKAAAKEEVEEVPPIVINEFIPEEAQEVMKALGLTLELHEPRQVSAELVADTDDIICMTKEQMTFINDNFKDEMGEDTKVRLLLSFVDNVDDVDDPQRGDIETFQQCFLTMMPALAALTDRIIRSAK